MSLTLTLKKKMRKFYELKCILHALFGALFLFSAPSPLLKHMHARQGVDCDE